MRARRLIADFARDRSAAIAPMYAIALFGLIMIAGVGWDYSRMATMDSELQNAADQAALAAATQLDGLPNAMPRARNAATGYLATSTSVWANETKLASGDERTVGGLTFEFFEDYNHVDDTPIGEITNDNQSERARYVRVTVGAREARYALTAIGGVLSSGDIQANAVATLEGAACNAPKLFVCAPSRDFPTSADKGRGLLLRQLPSANAPMAPGNFGFLDPSGEIRADRPTGNPNRELGRNSELSGCIASTGIESEPGFVATETNALNTRFDIYNPPSIPRCNLANGDFCPSQSTVSRWVYKIRQSNGADPATASCPSSPPNNAELMRLSDALAEMGTQLNPNPGYQQDACLISGACNSLGDGDWSGQAYMNQNHGALGLLDVSDGTRFGVYQWELALASTRLRVRRVGYSAATGTPRRGTLYCSYPQPTQEDPLVPDSTQKDRRILTVASVDCTGLNGRDRVDVVRWADLFLVDASASSGQNAGTIMTEVIGPAEKPGGGYAFQTYGRRKPVLVR